MKRALRYSRVLPLGQARRGAKQGKLCGKDGGKEKRGGKKRLRGVEHCSGTKKEEPQWGPCCGNPFLPACNSRKKKNGWGEKQSDKKRVVEREKGLG